jgi:hypothetical protein
VAYVRPVGPASSSIVGVLLASVVVGFTARSEAQEPAAVDVEVSPYVGRTSGELPRDGRDGAFAPTVGTDFVGLAARVEVRRLAVAGDRTRGLVFIAQSALERQFNSLLAEGSAFWEQIPPDQFRAAGAVAFGYAWRLVAFHVGVGVREVVGPPLVPTRYTLCASCFQPTYPSTRVSFYPDVGLRVGRADGLYGDVGIGIYAPAMALRPGLQVGLGYATRAGHGLALHYGAQSTVGDALGHRFDLAGSWSPHARVVLGLGVAVVSNERRVDYDGRATITVRLGP